MYFNFLYYFKPLGLFLNLLGVFPCTYTNNSSLPFKISNVSVAWAVMVFITVNVSIYFGMHLPDVTHLFLLSSMLHMCVVPTFIRNVKLIFKFISKIQNFDENRQLYFRNNCGLNHGNYYTQTLIVCYLLSILLITTFWSFPDNKYYKNSSIQLLSTFFRTIYMYALPLLIAFFLHEMKIRFETFQKLYPVTLKEVSVNKVQHEWFLDNTRILYFQLVSIVDTFNELFGGCLLFLFLVNFLNILYSLYGMLTTFTPFIFTYIWSTFTSYIMSFLSGDLILCSAEIKDILSELAVSNFSPKCKRQVELFLIQARVTPVHISASGYFEINSNTVNLMTTSVIAYLTVIINVLPKS